MKILVNGGSISRGPGSWPYCIESELNAKLVNLSQSGSGNTYIHETTIAELAQRNYDLVLIQWPLYVLIIKCEISASLPEPYSLVSTNIVKTIGLKKL